MRKSKEEASRHLFVGSAIDDAGLDPFQRAVLTHVERRGRCTESMTNMAKHLVMSLHSCRKAIKFLVENKWMSRERVPGRGIILQSTILRALPLPDVIGLDKSNMTGGPSKNDRAVIPDSIDKGYTLKDIPKGKKSPFVFEVGKSKRKKQGATEYGW